MTRGTEAFQTFSCFILCPSKLRQCFVKTGNKRKGIEITNSELRLNMKSHVVWQHAMLGLCYNTLSSSYFWEPNYKLMIWFYAPFPIQVASHGQREKTQEKTSRELHKTCMNKTSQRKLIRLYVPINLIRCSKEINHDTMNKRTWQIIPFFW